jgi:hypothetical protein
VGRRVVGTCMPQSCMQVGGRSYCSGESSATTRCRVAMWANWPPSQNWPSRTRQDGMPLSSTHCRRSVYHRQGRSLETIPYCGTLRRYVLNGSG